MELKSRQLFILRSILDAEEAPLAQQLLEDLAVSRRTFYYDIDKINDWLKQEKCGKLEIKGRLVYAQIADKGAVERKLTHGNDYFFSIAERRAMQIIFVALSSGNVTINRLMEHFWVSKNTVLGDIKEVKQELRRFCLTLSSTVKAGYLILGEEAAVRKAVWAQLQVLASPECSAMVGNFLQQSLVALTENDVDYFELCRCLIKQYEIDIGGDCLLPNIHMQSMMIQVSWIRSHKGFIINMSSDEEAALMHTLSYRSVELSVNKMKTYEIILQQREVYYITSLFLGIQTTDFTTQEQENLYIWDIAEKLISNFERVACLYFINRERLHRQLSHHIRPLYYRLKYGITATNPLVKDIFRMYPLVSEFTRRAIQDINIPLLTGISDDELAYLCVYFASNLSEKYAQQGEFSPEEVLIIGAENMATATLVREQMEDLFGLSLRYSVISAKRVKKWILDDYALVISLAPASHQFQYKNLVEIGPILGEAEQRKIIEVLKRNKTISQYNTLIEDIIERVERNMAGTLESSRLYLDLLRYFDERDHKKAEYVASDVFTEKINAGKILTLAPRTGWDQAVYQGSRALEGSNGQDRLGQRMRNLLLHKRVQMYRINAETVLVHCPMQGSVDSRIDVALLLASDSVVCGDGKKASILVFLSTIDRYAHWSVLKTIYQYFDSPSHISGIKQMYGKG